MRCSGLCFMIYLWVKHDTFHDDTGEKRKMTFMYLYTKNHQRGRNTQAGTTPWGKSTEELAKSMSYSMHVWRPKGDDSAQSLAHNCSPAYERLSAERATSEVTLALSLRKMAFLSLVASSPSRPCHSSHGGPRQSDIDRIERDDCDRLVQKPKENAKILGGDEQRWMRRGAP